MGPRQLLYGICLFPSGLKVLPLGRTMALFFRGLCL